MIGLLSLLGLALAASVRGPVQGASAPPAPAPDPARLAADVAWLADDAREGRRAGTAGEREAGEWIAERLRALGLEPAGEEGFFQGFEVPLPPERGGGSGVGPPEGELERDPLHVVPLVYAAAGEARGPLQLAGYGVEDPALGWSDFAGAEEGALAVVVRGEPPFEPPPAAGDDGDDAEEEPRGWGDAGSLFRKVMNAKRAGYAAVLVAEHPDSEDELPRFDPSVSARAGIPALAVSAELADRLSNGRYSEHVRAFDGRAAPAEVATLAEARAAADVVRRTATARNVLGLLRGRDPARTVVVGAHYDHLGRGGPGSLAPDASGEVHNGADDNASGAAVALEAARLLAAGPEPAGDVLFAFWSGEELGLLGSEHWIHFPTVPLESVVANVNLDMVGRAGDGVLQVLGAGTAEAFAGWMEPAGEAAGLALRPSLSGTGLGGSDHQVFLRAGIPALHLFSGVHPDYHRPSDDAERFESEGAAKVVALALDLVRRTQEAGRDELAYLEPAAEAMPQETSGWSVWFGSVPSYSDDGPGLLLAGTSRGSPAERAGLLAGDRIVAIDGVEVDSIYDFMHVLQTHKPGDVLRTRFERDGEVLELQVTLAPRGAR